jgi:glycosyltransferase involved in cell wall biosynthesis
MSTTCTDASKPASDLAARKDGKVPSSAKKPKQLVKKFRILTVSTGWSSTKGGIQTFNRAMCKALAQEEDVEIACMVTERTTEDDDDAKESGVTLVLEQSEKILDFLSDLQPNILIGHGIEKLTTEMVHLKRLLAAKQIPYKTVQILHVYPFLLEPKKESKGASSKANDKSDKLLAQAGKADIVAAVGPRLSKYWASNLKHKTFVPLIPGLYDYDCKSKVNRSQQVAKPLPRCLFISRLNSKEDQRSKGLDVAVQAMKLYDEQLAMENTSNAAKAIFDVRGFKDSAACDDFYETTQPQFKNISIEAKAFDADEEKVKRDMEAADVFLMPSPEEGFGLTSLEALTCGTPVLCSENSGFAEVLRQIQDNDKDRCKFINNWIVSTTDKEDFGKQLGERIWSMLQTPETIQATYKEAEELQKQWQERYSWPRMVRTLLDKLGVLINP